ncbi:hypothetical protein ARALYDRAFT_918321 [Arabidopsis lyrata subsp. lyrata]|uniref:Uncharacterized protein n=1 Tax=Arabidopsis lyrata subsp. lyrata TaxID=81972 RepID=D7MS77_ARALL|nr:hypothetical protein ARALYDRAFT_918321 [Arabidopsis lyrata subsp. lyrata]
MTSTPSAGRELSNPPSDGFSNLRFSITRVRLYDVSTNSLKGEFLHGGAVLDCCPTVLSLISTPCFFVWFRLCSLK